MNKYLALDFTFDSQNFKELNDFSKNTDKIEKYGISNEDYHHQEKKNFFILKIQITKTLYSSIKKTNLIRTF